MSARGMSSTLTGPGRPGLGKLKGPRARRNVAKATDRAMEGALDENVLVLNRLWQAINVIRARRALALLYIGRGRVVDDEFATHDWHAWTSNGNGAGDRSAYVQGIGFRVQVPRVLQLVDFDRVPRPKVKFTRTNVYLRDRHRCQYCGERGTPRELTLDHVHPRSRGGTTSWRNVVVSCVRCNVEKRDRRPEEAGMELLKEPRQPRWHPATALRPAERPHPQWRPFLPWASDGVRSTTEAADPELR